MTATTDPVLHRVRDGVATITLNRPDRLNAMNGEMVRSLLDLFDRTDGDDDVRAVVVTGAGRAFCAGADLSQGAQTFDYASHGGAAGAHRDPGGVLVLRIYRSLKPVIAAITAGFLLRVRRSLAGSSGGSALPTKHWRSPPRSLRRLP